LKVQGRRGFHSLEEDDGHFDLSQLEHSSWISSMVAS
jgi:hypothetical protein